MATKLQTARSFSVPVTAEILENAMTAYQAGCVGPGSLLKRLADVLDATSMGDMETTDPAAAAYVDLMHRTSEALRRMGNDANDRVQAIFAEVK